MEEVPITITAEEIEAAHVNKEEAATEEQKVAYHNEVVPIIEKKIREALKKKEKQVGLLDFELRNQPEKAWKSEVLQKITKKFTNKKINAHYVKDMAHFYVLFKN